jgi:hypothetical protein
MAGTTGGVAKLTMLAIPGFPLVLDEFGSEIKKKTIGAARFYSANG